MLALRKSFSTLFITSLLFTGSVASLPEARAQIPEAPADSLSRTNLLLQDELYFGRSRPGGIVSEEQFQRFLRNVVTPRFPDGLTVFDASGQFRTSTGTIIREPTKVLILIYPNSPAKRRAIEEIINLYKTQFQQESVLRVTSVPVKVGF
ncbi:DUF3574 domain-containing protein [Gloeocapsopsis crepidinum LEGE 06123]|uniref:DUF3574 domain-containing protein n=1 Tax=Gloeocapsopsis crepidinum LEGE 06123 TaxID=588587 RepID=A0ABR9UZA5_9CHRO|nr:DUF3574 domain-containing protein [Gloeocapsopsis crepidinum]MBE9193611.1 DUF3574 domain-containing protein [Gloeocapsopsis crepidinum LEGE 06123]